MGGGSWTDNTFFPDVQIKNDDAYDNDLFMW